MQPTPRRPDYDQALKRLLLRAHDGFLALIAPGLIWRGERSPELPAVARQADLVWEVEGKNGQRGILHVELQTKVEDDIGLRVVEYAVRLCRREEKDVLSVVIFLRPVTNVPDPRFTMTWMGASTRLDFVYDTIRLWELPPEQVLDTAYYDLWPLAGLMAGVTADKTIEVAEQIAATPLAHQERQELTELLVTLAAMRVPGRLLRDALRRRPMLNEILKESTVGEIFREDDLRDALRLVLEGRFQTLDSDLLAAIQRADEGALEELLRHAAVETFEQLRARLGLS